MKTFPEGLKERKVMAHFVAADQPYENGAQRWVYSKGSGKAFSVTPGTVAFCTDTDGVTIDQASEEYSLEALFQQMAVIERTSFWVHGAAGKTRAVSTALKYSPGFEDLMIGLIFQGDEAIHEKGLIYSETWNCYVLPDQVLGNGRTIEVHRNGPLHADEVNAGSSPATVFGDASNGCSHGDLRLG